MSRGNELGPEFENPFASIGLTQEAIRAITTLNDPEKTRLVINGLRRVYAQAFHPDTGSELPPSADVFFNNALIATSTLAKATPENLQTLAKASTKGRGRQQEKTPNPISVPDTAKDIIGEMATAKTPEIGLTLGRDTRIMVHSYMDTPNDAYWCTFQRLDDDHYRLTSYSSSSRDTKHKPHSDKLEEENIPWRNMSDFNSAPISKDNHLSLNATIEVLDNGTWALRDNSGRIVPADISRVIRDHNLKSPGIYSLRGEYVRERGKTTFKEALLYNPYMEHAGSEELELKILGSVDKKFFQELASTYSKARGNYMVPADPVAKAIGTNLGFIAKKSNMFKLGNKIPELFYDVVARNYSPTISKELLIVTDGNAIFVPGKIQRLLYNN